MVIIPLELLFEVLPWPRSKHQFALYSSCCSPPGAIVLDLFRIHEHRTKAFFATSSAR